MEAWSRACPGEVEEPVAGFTLAGCCLSMTPTVKFFQFWYLESLHAGRCTQADTIQPVTVITAAARAASRRVSPYAVFEDPDHRARSRL